jgi:glycosyltransferase involved in cell wall biosynthesis
MSSLCIITINYNNASGLLKTIESVVTQTKRPFEYIIIDGGSKDDSIQHIQQYSSNIDYWVSESDNGIYNAMNKGIKAAKADYLLFLNSGDCLVNKDVIASINQYLTGNEAIVYGNLQLIKKGIVTTEISPKKMGIYELMMSTIWHPTAFIKRELFLNFGLYNEELSIVADYEFFVRCIVKHKVNSKYINLPITLFDLTGLSNNPQHEQKQNLEREQSWKMNTSPIRLHLIKMYIWVKRRVLYYNGNL